MIEKRPLSFLSVILLMSCTAFSQRDTNQTINGQKQGYWIVYGHMNPSKGYGSNCKIEEGEYKNGRKEGKWIIYHKEQCNVPRTIGNFVGGRPRGGYQKYAEDGTLKEEGTFENGKQIGSFKQLNSDGVVVQEKNFDADGKEDGKVIFRYDDGQVQIEKEMKNGVPTGTETHYYPNGDVKKVVKYGPDGSIVSSEEKEMVHAAVKVEEKQISSPPAPDGRKGTTNGKKFDPNSYNKIYNDNKELWMDGKFMDGKLLDGKLYKYDSDGILLKIEIWKNGKYHSDGQLN